MKKVLLTLFIGFTIFTVFGQKCAIASQTYKKANIYNSKGQKVGYKKETYKTNNKKTESKKVKDEYYDSYNHRKYYVKYN